MESMVRKEQKQQTKPQQHPQWPVGGVQEEEEENKKKDEEKDKEKKQQEREVLIAS
jgi:hypothetical protein